VLVKYRQHAANVFGVVGRRKKKNRNVGRAGKRRKELARIRVRMDAYCAACPETLVAQKRLLRALVASYRNFAPWNDIRRVGLFLVNYKRLLVVKNYSTFRKYLFCLKMLVKIK
jgi:hypothetical protein